MLSLSVIICSHNPRPDYFQRCLAGLKDQSLAREQWELILIDNASDRPLSENWDLGWHANGAIVTEPSLGLSIARRHGMRVARAELLVFVDDDVVLAPDYLARVLEIAQSRPRLALWGSGHIEGEFEIPLPEKYKKYQSLLSVRIFDEDKIAVQYPAPDATPWGGGMCVRTSICRQHLVRNRTDKLPLTGRKGKELAAGEDEELSLLAFDNGMQVGTFTALKITHLIPRTRICEDYLLRAAEGAKYGMCIIQYKIKGRLPHYPFSLGGAVHFIGSLLRSRGFERRMHLASLRGALRARRAIAAGRTGAPRQDQSPDNAGRSGI